MFVGDYSGLSLFLSRGLAAIGHEVILFSNGDHWKNLPRGHNIWTPAKSKAGSVVNQIRGLAELQKLLRPTDVLILATEYIFSRFANGLMLERLMDHVGQTILLHAGCSDRFHGAYQHTVLCKECKVHDLKSERCKFEASQWPFLERMLRETTTIVPFTSVYAESAKLYPVKSERITAPLHFPVDAEYIETLANEATAIRPSAPVMHGTNRVGFKGTKLLEKMLSQDDRLRDLVCITPRMPFVEFLGLVRNSSMVLDQFFANGYGMAGAISLMLGTPVAFGYTAAHVPADFVGTGIVPMKITGSSQEDALVVDQALRAYLERPVDAAQIKAMAHERHDHVGIARHFAEVALPLRD
ncbi:hypothetical protein EXJ73_17950 [Pelomonas aquatica]|uniref:Glycosyltransferase subfamily 4-like N-terminal domain-containing protein n=1 Tax=Pelomonas aquatica TaxID=431058 RepID=A0A9X4LIT5_9BURK|nr:hypothetical protein [Pelomonas aquatica]